MSLLSDGRRRRTPPNAWLGAQTEGHAGFAAFRIYRADGDSAEDSRFSLWGVGCEDGRRDGDSQSGSVRTRLSFTVRPTTLRAPAIS